MQVTLQGNHQWTKWWQGVNGDMAIEIVIKQSQYRSANYDAFKTNDESPSVHLSIINEKSNMDEEPLMGFSDMKTKPSDVSSYS